MIKVLIVDDDLLIRESLRLILSTFEGIEVIDTKDSGKGCLDFLKANEVDLVLLDLRMPIMDGIEVLKQQKLEGRKEKFLVLTTFDEDDLIKNALYYGASGYILKNSTPDHIAQAIRTVASGNSVFHPDVLKSISQASLEPKTDWDKYELSTRELDIIREVAGGLSNKEIANTLYISEGTVKNYITSILGKMGLSHRTQIAVAYLKHHSNG